MNYPNNMFLKKNLKLLNEMFSCVLIGTLTFYDANILYEK